MGVGLSILQGHLIFVDPNGPSTEEEEKEPWDTMVLRSKFGGAIGAKPI